LTLLDQLKAVHFENVTFGSMLGSYSRDWWSILQLAGCTTHVLVFLSCVVFSLKKLLEVTSRSAHAKKLSKQSII